MIIDEYEITVSQVEDQVAVIIDGRDAWRDDYAHLVMSKEEALTLINSLYGCVWKLTDR